MPVGKKILVRTTLFGQGRYALAPQSWGGMACFNREKKLYNAV
jgi:hypothetical protein